MNAREILERVKTVEIFGMKTAENDEKILKLLNMAISDVYSSLDFCTEQITIPLILGQSNYDLPNRLISIKDQYRQFIKVPNDIRRYYGTEFRWPLEDDKTFYVPLNTYDHKYAINMQTPFRINVSNPDPGGKVLLSCILTPEPITIDNVDNGQFQMYPQVVEVVMDRLAYLVYKKKNGHNSETKTYWGVYMTNLELINQNGLIPKATVANMKLEQKGFV